MIVDERMVTYINSLDMGNTPLLNEIEKEAKADLVPVIRREMQSFLKVLLAIHRPLRVLEVGTAEKRIPIARENFRRAGRENQITLLEGDAADILKELQESYDLIFMDAAKGQYIHFLDDVLRLMKPGSVLVSDNVLQGGDIIESHYAVERRNRTIYKRMREYLYELKHNDKLLTSVIPLGDGVTVSVRKDMK